MFEIDGTIAKIIINNIAAIAQTKKKQFKMVHMILNRHFSLAIRSRYVLRSQYQPKIIILTNKPVNS